MRLASLSGAPRNRPVAPTPRYGAGDDDADLNVSATQVQGTGVQGMVEDARMSDFGSWMQSGFVGSNGSRAPYRYSVPRAMSEGRSNVSPGIGVSVEEKVSDLIQSYPHLKAFLKSRAKDENARIRDLAISSQERDQLLLQIIAARRQQLPSIGSTGPASRPAPGPQFRSRLHQPRRRKPAQAWPKGFSTRSQAGSISGKWHKRLWG